MKHHWHFCLLLVAYFALVAPQLNRGLASLDGHGIISVVRNLADGGGVGISRPPGHPTTEYYISGSIAWLLKHSLDWEFSDELYLTLQFMAGLAGLALFYELLYQLGVPPWRAAVGAGCMAFSPYYLFNSFDGEEFLFAIVFVLMAVRFLVIPGRTGTPFSRVRLCLSMLAFALATGCRPEAVIIGVIYPLYYYFHPELCWKGFLLSLPALGVMMLAVWWPVLFSQGIAPPTGSGMNFLQSILGAGYKLSFLFVTLPVFALLAWSVICAGFEFPARIRRAFPVNFMFCASLAITGCFLIFFLRRSEKPAYILCALPFLLLLALNLSNRLVLLLGVLTSLGCVIGIDIFKDRVITLPYFTSGSYCRAISGKPYARLDYLREVADLTGTEPLVVVANAWPWDFAYHLRRGSLPLREETLADSSGEAVPVFRPVQNDAVMILSRQAADNLAFLERYQSKGYEIAMDRVLFRSLFWKYNVTAPVGESARVNGLTLRLF